MVNTKTGHMYSHVKLNFKEGLFLVFFDLRPPSLVNLTFYIMARAQGKMRYKYQKNAKWQKITFRGPIWVPKVAFWGFWGHVWGGVGDLKILILAPEVPFLVPPNCLKWVVLANLGVPEMALPVPKSKF